MSLQVDGTFPVGSRAEPVLWISTSQTALWVGRRDDVIRLTPDGSGRRRFAVGSPAGLVAAGGTAHILNAQPSKTIDVSAPDTAWVPVGNEVVRLGSEGQHGFTPLGGAPLDPVFASGTVWVITYLGRGAVVPVDATSLSVFRPVAIDYPLALASGEGAIWAVNARGVVSRIDPVADRVVARVPTAPTLRTSIAAGEGRVWVAVQNPD